MADCPLKSGKRFDTDQTRNILPQDYVSLARSNRNQRCFSQFDRKTDCFQDGELRMDRHTWGRTRGGKQIVVPNCLTRNNAAPSIILKAVCGTQTRHGVSVNKYQTGSQKQWWNKRWITSCCGTSQSLKLKRTAASTFIWQKSGIGMAAVSPVPLGSRKGKGNQYPVLIPIREKP